MFDNSRYLTRGVNQSIPLELQIFMWSCIGNLKIEKDYLETNLPGSLINRSNLRCKILDDVINKKVGDVFTVRIIQATSTKDLISFAKEPPKLVIITADPELQYIDENHNIVKREKLK